MNLNLKWHLRQNALSILTLPISFTGGVLVVMLYRCYKFYTTGLAMYPDLQIPKNFGLDYALEVFWFYSWKGPAWWLFASFPADSVLRRYLFKLER